MKLGILYICPTPIGNLEDITVRTLRILEQVDLIAAEDTRHSIKLLNYYNIKKPLISYHEHNKKMQGNLLIEKLKSGVNIAIVTDAGMPGISDPGQDIVKLAIANQIQLVCLPGPTASITALVLSGLSTEKFVFEGFLPSRKKDRIDELERIKDEYRTIIFYESPYRILDFLRDLNQIFGNRRISISRELTKLHEENFRGTIEEAVRMFQKKRPRGEFVLVVEGADMTKVDPYENIGLEEHVNMYIDTGLTRKDAVKKVAQVRDISKNLVYRASINKDSK